VNVAGFFNATQALGGAMSEAGRGSIVNIGSLYASIAPIPAFYEHLDPPFTKPPPTVPRRRHREPDALLRQLWGPMGCA
jgi:NAD(P)-dependent dehydrogenase (short-subunit alcohol dehydrogenase family)